MNESLCELMTTHVWQICIVFGIIFVIGQIPHMKKRPHLMLVLWVLFFVKCLVPPVVNSPVSPLAALTPRFAIESMVAESEPSALLAKNQRLLTSHSPEDRQSEFHASESLGNRIETYFGAIWILGSIVIFSVFAVNFLVVRQRIFSSAIDDDGLHVAETEATRILSRLKSSLEMPSNDVNLVVSDNSLGPLVFGFFQPTIVLPRCMLERSAYLKPVIAHELCHVWRRDHLLGILQIIAQVILWFHPLVWIASRKVNRLCEVCCDDDTIRLFELDSKSYANGLLDVLSMRHILRTVAMTPGIRPVEVTKQRLNEIVSNRRRGSRQSHVIYVGIFLCLAIPAFSNGNTDSGPSSSAEPAAEDELSPANPALTNAEVAQRRAEMDFLLGEWDVVSGKGEVTGRSIFRYEKSGKMIREDWTAANGDTAQGITFYDPNEACWKMTWVDSSGTIMESSGQWVDQSLTLEGWITSKDGIRRKGQTRISKRDDGTLLLELSVAIKNRMQPVSKSIYRPSD